MYDVSVLGLTSSHLTCFPSYGPIHVPTGICCLAQTPQPAPGMLDTHNCTSSGNEAMA